MRSTRRDTATSGGLNPAISSDFQIAGRTIVVLELDRREKDTYRHIDAVPTRE
jgi:hypothetical protein